GDALERRAPRGTPRPPGGGRGDGDRPAAAVDRERDRLHAPRGRARAGESDRPAARVRASPGDGPRRAARPRSWARREGGGEPQRARLRDRVARPARARDRGERHGLGVIAPCAPLRPSLAAYARPMSGVPYDPEHIARFFDAYGEREWERFDATAMD